MNKKILICLATLIMAGNYTNITVASDNSGSGSFEDHTLSTSPEDKNNMKEVKNSITDKEISDSESDDESISSDTLYMSLSNAWINLNNSSKNKDDSYYESALSSVLAYITNGGSKEEIVFRKLLGRICYEHFSNLSIGEKKYLGLEQITDIEKYGLLLLNSIEQIDGEVEDYLAIRKL